MQAIGAAGELIVQARLLIRGWTAGNVNTGGMMNAPAIDLLAAKGSRTVRIAVKATGHNNANVQWSVPTNWTTLFKGDVRPDFVIFVWFTNPNDLDECRIFIVPADVVDNTLIEGHRQWHKFPRRDGSPRKRSKHTAITWTGNPNPATGVINRGMERQWAKYENAWDLLEQDTSKRRPVR